MALEDELKRHTSWYKETDAVEARNTTLTERMPANLQRIRTRFGLYHQSLEDVLSSPIGQVTSRDQIIDPYSVVLQSQYKNTKKGRADYEADLAQAKQFAERQEAAYQEWYESPEQQALRQRAAGINPDLVGLSETAAGDVQSTDFVPGQSFPTLGQSLVQGATSIASVVSSLSGIASLATAFSDIPLKAQTLNNLQIGEEALTLANIDSLKHSLAGDISDLLATAVQSHLNSDSPEPFNYDAWFSDDSNFEPLKPVYGNFSSYPAALSLARKQSLQFHKNASNLQSDTLNADYSVGQILSDPRLSPSQKLTAIQLRPYTEACIAADKSRSELEKVLNDWNRDFRSKVSVDKAAVAFDSSNDASAAQSNYTVDYLGEVDASLVAAFERYLRDTTLVASELERNINTGYLAMYNCDPLGYDGFRAAYLYGSKGGHSWQDAFITRSQSDVESIIDSLVAEAQASQNTAKLRAFISAIGPLASMDPDAWDNWKQNNLGWSTYRAQI